MPDYIGAEIKRDFFEFMLRILGLEERSAFRPILIVDTKNGKIYGKKDKRKQP